MIVKENTNELIIDSQYKLPKCVYDLLKWVSYIVSLITCDWMLQDTARVTRLHDWRWGRH